MTIAELLVEVRNRKGLSLRAAARELGCSEMTYRMWERGVWVPGAERALEIASWTGRSKVEVLELMGVLDRSETGHVREKAPLYQPRRRHTRQQRLIALERLQSMIAQIPPDVDLVAELLAERREEARREVEER